MIMAYSKLISKMYYILVDCFMLCFVLFGGYKIQENGSRQSALVVCLAKIAPEDVAAGLTVIYGFAPRLKLGNEHRVGFGFRFGNHADFQVLYEFGPQAVTKSPLTVTKPRAIVYRQPVRKPRRRPIIEFLLRTGLLREVERVETHVYSTVRNMDINVR